MAALLAKDDTSEKCNAHAHDVDTSNKTAFTIVYTWLWKETHDHEGHYILPAQWTVCSGQHKNPPKNADLARFTLTIVICFKYQFKPCSHKVTVAHLFLYIRITQLARQQRVKNNTYAHKQSVGAATRNELKKSSLVT